MNAAFHELVCRVIQDRGSFILEHPAQCRGLLSDYAKGRYKREIRLFLLTLEAGGYRKFRDSYDSKAEKARFLRDIQEDYGISQAEADEAFAMMLEILEHIASQEDDETGFFAQKIEELEKSARKGDYRAMYELGLLLEKLTWYEESNYWFKKAAKQGLILFERHLTGLEKGEKKEKPDFVKIPGGAFMMGSPITDPGWSAQETQHKVKVSGFYLGKYEVTQGEYQAVTGTNPSRFIGNNLPVENINWFDAVSYCNARSLMEKLAPAYMIHRENVTWNRESTGYRLPTEAEWEYACRAGTGTPFSTGTRIAADQANYNGTADIPRGVYRQKTVPVGTFPANPWGLYDMHGNVYEWCWDWFGEYPITVQQDPVGPASGVNRVIRGGSWNYSARSLRSASRNHDVPAYRGGDVGFRLLLPIAEAES